jgi:hypothetical protein
MSPNIVTAVFPLTGPLEGMMELIFGGCKTKNEKNKFWLAVYTTSSSRTWTCTVPWACGGVKHDMLLVVIILAAAELSSKRHLNRDEVLKNTPEIVKLLLPCVGPDWGCTSIIAGRMTVSTGALVLDALIWSLVTDTE